MLTKIYVDNKEIDYLTINSKGRVVESGEKGADTFIGTMIKTDSVEVGKRVELTFNDSVYTKLNYRTVKIETLGRKT